MEFTLLIAIFVLVVVASVAIYVIRRRFNKDVIAQRELDQYLQRNFSTEEIGKLYERYIGYLYETDGYDVIYHGALNGFADLGRDLIAGCVDEVHVIQAKCWSKNKTIQEKDIFQLFGTMTHFKLTAEKRGRRTKAVFFTTAKYSGVAQDAAKVLGVELRTEYLNRSYPMIKCSVSKDGAKLYYLPFDSNYDTVKIDLHREEHFVSTVKDAVSKGFRRAG